MTAQPALLHTQSFNPFDVQQDHAYAIWRDWKLEHAPSRLEQLLVEVSNPMQLTPAEQEALLSRCSHTNMALYACDPQQWQGKEVPKVLGKTFGLTHLDHNWLADEDAITSLQVNPKGEHPGYIPYTDRAIHWHTDGYYNAPYQQIHGLILHCEHPAFQGGENALLDPDLAYIALRETDPKLITALMQADAMTIPARHDASGVARLPQTGPVFRVDTQRLSLHMRYTARTRSILWKADALVEEARLLLHELLESDFPYILKGRLEAGMGLISNNVLHNRGAFEDHPQTSSRLLYRARYYDRINRSSLLDQVHWK